ncbi:MAG: hypothetical protein OCD76_21005 [Reichenbachiella sp.]
MRSIIFILLLMGLSLRSYGQFAFNNISFEVKDAPISSYRIIQTRDGKTTKVEEFNATGRLVFKYIQGDIPPFFNWSEPHRFIYAFEYDESGNTVKRYAFNSNAGHNIYEYDYSDDGSTKYSYQRSYPDEGGQNTNAYSNIERIKTFSDLIKSSEVAVMNSSERIFLNREHLDKNGNPIKYVEYSKMHKDTLSTTTKYDVELQEIKKTVVNSKGEMNRENVYEYPDSRSQISTINHYRNGQIAFFYRFAETKNDEGETEFSYSERKGILNVRHNQYEDGYLTSITVYKTKFKGKLIVPVSKKFKKVAQMKYTYNDIGLLEKEEMNNYESGEQETRSYKYQIENL